MRFSPTARFGLPALAIGVLIISFSPLLVQVSEVGPGATAVYRALFALPALSAWMLLERRQEPVAPRKLTARDWWLLALTGLFFAGDLVAWHSSIRMSGVANATFLAHLSTPIISLGAWLLFGERLTLGFMAGLVLAMAGTALIMGASSLVEGGSLLGDGLGLLTAFFYGAYLLTIKHLRESLPSGLIMAVSTGFSLIALVAAALVMGGGFIPVTLLGWGTLVAIGLVIHAGGQGLITVAFRHLSASFASVALLATPVLAALFGWLLLGETLTLLQSLGCAAVLAGIALSQRLGAAKR
ncbi:MAG: DMT family transporter [Alphaproteobacteria bacterium]|jgi:drug/metabolite transporter (DMT)-like permease|nr:DMT family transporter [Alphaproteobacteria bacterium]MDP6590779.1 DMT family transporter [Alphaproteobacteria bacterium]MDP6819088.1 DMT family transporter [Alphaproteobacteria bacterium]|tara:strand:+ start:73 stop:966 length:894 start_codon:yes stop_codon:yes gene_type:complete